MLDSRTRPPGGRPTARRVTLLALLIPVLVAVPAAAEAKNFKVDDRVTDVPTASGGAVTAPLQLTREAGNKLRLGRRGVREDQAARAAPPFGSELRRYGISSPASREAVMWIAPGSRIHAIRLSDWSRSSMYSNATACSRLA